MSGRDLWDDIVMPASTTASGRIHWEKDGGRVETLTRVPVHAREIGGVPFIQRPVQPQVRCPDRLLDPMKSIAQDLELHSFR
jgi:hypothetical protein